MRREQTIITLVRLTQALRGCFAFAFPSRYSPDSHAEEEKGSDGHASLCHGPVQNLPDEEASHFPGLSSFSCTGKRCPFGRRRESADEQRLCCGAAAGRSSTLLSPFPLIVRHDSTHTQRAGCEKVPRPSPSASPPSVLRLTVAPVARLRLGRGMDGVAVRAGQ
jgi:hypothetical protein